MLSMVKSNRRRDLFTKTNLSSDSEKPDPWASAQGHPLNRRNGARRLDLLKSIFCHTFRIFLKLLRPVIAGLVLGLMVLMVQLTWRGELMTVLGIVLNAPENLIKGNWEWQD